MAVERQVSHCVSGSTTSDGAGVKLRRIVTGQWHQRLDPWLMLDAFGSDKADDYIAGFPPHPHRSFETITYMLAGRMAHQDNRGNHGVVEAGGVQWMTAGRGIVHSEMPAQEAGLMQGFQFWLNLPSAQKMTEPKWADVAADAIPVWANDCVQVKVIAGTFNGVNGVIQREHTQPMILDVVFLQDTVLSVPIEAGHHAFVYSYVGSARIGEIVLTAPQMGVLDNEGEVVNLTGAAGARLLVVSGKPLNEPIAANGPFVMNTQAELRQAFEDYRLGRF
ncbi:MAG: pirin family protein [Proteobacteria bacterium]|nr:pirin family protein [Pseudomonadota bacterium]